MRRISKHSPLSAAAARKYYTSLAPVIHVVDKYQQQSNEKKISTYI